MADHLKQLVAGEFLYQKGVVPEASYIFKHTLIRDAAYNSLLISRRQQYHQLVAQVYEESFPESVETQPELLAHHYFEAGLIEKAVSYWQLAGERALSAYAHEEALGHFQRGLSAKNISTTGSQPAPDAESAALLFGLGRTQSVMSGHWMDRMTAAIINLKRAFEYYRQAGQVERALAVAQHPIRPGAGIQVGLRSLVEPAVELAPPE